MDGRKINRKTLKNRLKRRPSWKGYEIMYNAPKTPKNNNKKNNAAAATASVPALPPPPPLNRRQPPLFEAVALGSAPAGMPSFQRSMAFHGNNNTLPAGFIPLGHQAASQGNYYEIENAALPNAPPFGRSRRNRRTRRNRRNNRK